MGLVSILIISHITNINSNIDRTFLDLRNDLREMRNHIDGQKERITALEQGAQKDRIAALEKLAITLQIGIDEQKQKTLAAESLSGSLREEIKVLREENKEQSKIITEIREKIAVLSVRPEPKEKTDK